MESLPKKRDCENFTKSDAVNYLLRVIEKLKVSKIQYNSNSIHDLISRLSSSYFDYDTETVDRISEEFTRNDFDKILCYFFIRLTDPLDIKNKTLDLFLTFLTNFSNKSPKFASKIANSKILKVLIDICTTEEYLCKIYAHECNYLIWQCVLIVHNIARDPNNLIIHRVDELKKALVKFIQHNDNDKLGIASMLTLSYLVGEDDIYLLDEGSRTISNLLGKINFAFENGKYGGYTISELLYGLQCISVNDNLKKRIDDAGGIPILIDIINRNVEKEIEPSLATIENLCFNFEIREKLRTEFQIGTVLEPLKEHSSLQVREHCDGILWMLENKAETFHKKSKDLRNIQFDVFLSYSWANQKKILEILEHLKLHGIRTWIDKEQMRGSSIEVMANGIENSKLIIMAISPAYKSSSNCRHEAEYAFKINKPIIPVVMTLKYKADSWLGFIVGCKVYYEFSERRNVRDVITELLEDIEYNLARKICGNEKVVDGDKVQSKVIDGDKSNKKVIDVDKEKQKVIDGHKGDEKQKAKCEKSNSIGKLDESKEKWTNNDVLQWLDSTGMGHLKMHFADVDGSILSMMLEIRANSPEYFNRALENQFSMNFIDAVRFHKILNNLVSS